MALESEAEARWEAFGGFLGRDLFLVGPDARRALLGGWDAIARAEAEIDDRLSVGLVGGTGVGKSTLVNALAGAEISATGPRRPTTDLVVAYRHRRTRIPAAFPREHLAVPEVEHERPALERVILLDFPDFDSVEAAHGEILRACLPHLDVLLVLADDMKYADETLFELLGRLSQSRENLYVVLNKIDRLERRYGEEAGSVVDGILEDLSEKLARHAGIRLGRERLFAISAEAAFRGEGRSGEFPRIVGLLEEYRAEKRRRAAKERNIDARKAALREDVRRVALDPARLERAERLLERTRARKAELERLLASISTEVLSARERRALAREASRDARAAFGFPIDLVVAAGSALRRARATSRGAIGL
ncbi:MAG: GTPase, partial [Planctomycetota bacterium]